MSDFGQRIVNGLDPHDLFRGYTNDWPLTDFRFALAIAFGYVVLTISGSAIMKAGVPAIDPYPLKFVYNVSQIFLCSYMSVEAFMLAYRNGYSICCNDYNRENPAIAKLLWLFYVSKIWDFWDTIFIILGKKWRQLSFLHVYHHFTVFLIYWLDMQVMYDGDVYITILLNGFIHAVMYTYYFIAMHTKVPETGKNLPIWWKSSLTIMQMIQFLIMMGQGVYSYAMNCQGVNHKITIVCFWYTMTLLLMFAKFYGDSYSKKKSKKK